MADAYITPDRHGISRFADAGEVEHKEVWEAVGILSAGHGLSFGEALRQICERGLELRVHPDDVAAFVLWNGVLPD